MSINRQKYFIWVSLSIACLLHSVCFAQTSQSDATCPANLPETASSDDFSIQDEGEVLHIASGLVFMRCSIGQVWANNSCEGEPTAYTWQESLAISLESEYNDKRSWRLPNLKELSIITERACVRPAISDDIFPNTSPDEYWTSSPAILQGESAWAVSFTNASHAMRLKNRSLFVRLVRTKLDSE